MSNESSRNPSESQKDLARAILKEKEPHLLLKSAFEEFLGVKNPYSHANIDEEAKKNIREANKRKLHLLLVLLANGGEIKEDDKEGNLNLFLHGMPWEETTLGDYSSINVALTGLEEAARLELKKTVVTLAQDSRIQSSFTPKANISRSSTDDSFGGESFTIGSITQYALLPITANSNPFTPPYETGLVFLEAQSPVGEFSPTESENGTEFTPKVKIEQQRAGSVEKPELRFKEIIISLPEGIIFKS